MLIGLTGTRHGMTTRQRIQLRQLLSAALESPAPHQFHHGDCVGSDVQAAEIAAELGYETIAHPGFDPRKPDDTPTRAHHASSTILQPFPFLTRDRHIVDAVERMIATPAQEWEIQRSGTWTTVRYARKKNKSIHVIAPNGNIA